MSLILTYNNPLSYEYRENWKLIKKLSKPAIEVFTNQTLTKNNYYDNYQSIAHVHAAQYPYNFIKNTDTVVIGGFGAHLIHRNISQPLIFSTLTSKVIAFEADPECVCIAQDYINEYNINNITIIDKALWERPNKIVQLGLYSGGAGGNTIGMKSDNVANVETATLNDLEIDIDFLHLTINGSEYKALLGASKLLNKIPLISIAYVFPGTRIFKERQKAVDLLRDNGYTIGITQACPILWSDMEFNFIIAAKDKQILLDKGFN